MYTTTDDVNVHLPTDKISVSEADLPQWDREAGRIIRGYTASTFTPTVIASWADPATTPEVIRGIAGRLIASAYYAERFSEDDTDYPDYAQHVYNEAISMLRDINDGKLLVLSVDGTQTLSEQHSLSDLDFWPNDDTDRKFSMGDVF